MNVFNKLILKARDLKLIEGTVLENTGDKVKITHLMFTYDSLIFYKPDARMLLNLRCILLCFQAVSSLKIIIENLNSWVMNPEIMGSNWQKFYVVLKNNFPSNTLISN